MKKALLFGAVAVILLGGKVQATQLPDATATQPDATVTTQQTEQVDANAIMTKAEQQMNSMTVYGMEMWMNGQMMMDIALDMNSKVVYANVTVSGDTMTIWGDGNTKMAYAYDSTVGRYYFTPDTADFSELESQKNEAMQTVKTDPSLTYSYVGKVNKTVKGQTTECYQIHASVTQNETTSTGEYYISTTDYRLISMDISLYSKAIVGSTGNMTMQFNLYYPQSLAIPADVIAAATISPDYTVDRGKVTYGVKYVKGQPVLSVKSAVKAKNKVKIEDSVTICGKEYPVYEIGEYAFSGNKKIKSVSIGKNVQVIGKRAFYRCKKLSSINIHSKNIKKIGTYAFKANNGTVKVKVPAKKLAKYKKVFAKSKKYINLIK